MNCPICNKELEIKNKKVGENANGEAIYNEFAICHDCKKQWNLDKKRAKIKAAAQAQEEKTVEKSIETPVIPTADAADVNKPVRKVKKKRPVNPDAGQMEEAKKEVVKEELPVIESIADAPTRVIPTEELEAKLQEKPRKKKRPVRPDVQEGTPDNGELPERPRKKKRRPVEAETASDANLEVPSEPAAAPKKKRKPAPKTTSEESVNEELPERPRKRKRRPVEDDLSELSNVLSDEEFEEKTYSNIPPKHIREAREKEMRQNYQNMLDEDDEDEGGSPIILILIIIILLLAVAAFAGYWFFLR